MDHIKNLARLINSGDQTNFDLAMAMFPKESEEYIENTYGLLIDCFIKGNNERNVKNIETIRGIEEINIYDDTNIDIGDVLKLLTINLKNIHRLCISNSIIDMNINILNVYTEISKIEFFNSHIKIKLPHFHHMSKLTHVRMERCDLKNIPTTIRNIKNLEYLNLEGNHIEKVFDLSNLDKLNTLILSNNKIEKIPESMAGFKNLKRIHIDGNPINSIHESFYETRFDLITCDLNDIKIPRFHEYICEYYVPTYNRPPYRSFHLIKNNGSH